jgi:hypothetical protein
MLVLPGQVTWFPCVLLLLLDRIMSQGSLVCMDCEGRGRKHWQYGPGLCYYGFHELVRQRLSGTFRRNLDGAGGGFWVYKYVDCKRKWTGTQDRVIGGNGGNFWRGRTFETGVLRI